MNTVKTMSQHDNCTITLFCGDIIVPNFYDCAIIHLFVVVFNLQTAKFNYNSSREYKLL